MYFGSFPVGRTCSHHARNICPGIPVQTTCHLKKSGPVSVLEMFGGVWWCLVVFGGVSMC